jgi:hypothetical protein
VNFRRSDGSSGNGWGAPGAAAIGGCYQSTSFAADSLQMQQKREEQFNYESQS